MKSLIRVVLTAVLCGVSLLTGATAASAEAGEDYFVVDTQFRRGPNDIVDAGGAFADCTTVRDLWGAATQLSPQRFLFEGEKKISCDGGSVTIYYAATAASGQVTIGTWTITSSTLAGATSGGGAVHGDTSLCTPVRAGGGCILDTFTGDVS
jgi:hypothetical protein